MPRFRPRTFPRWLMLLPRTAGFRALTWMALLSVWSACRRDEIRVYTVLKQAESAPAPEPALANATAPNEGLGAGSNLRRARPEVTYVAPPNWREAPGNELSLANFQILDSQGGETGASVNITGLAEMRGHEEAIVNMWRAQMGQPALSPDDARQALKSVEIGQEAGQVFEVAGERSGQPIGIVTAFVHRGDVSWFYKLQGPAAVVSAQKTAFLDFLKTIRIKEQDPSATAAVTSPSLPRAMSADRSTNSAQAPAPVASASAENPNLVSATEEPAKAPEIAGPTPAGWQPLAPGQMQIARYSVPQKAGAKAEVFVSVFANDTGGVLANVNRWRRQIGLEEVDAEALKKCTRPLGNLSDATLAELDAGSRKILGAILPRDGQWWFFKMIGDTEAVDAERENFVRFVTRQP